MRVLIVDAFDADTPGKQLADHAVGALERSGHDVHRLDLRATDFPVFMTEDERRRYHDVGDNICCPHVEASVAQVQAADAVVFAYPTTLFTVPAVLKGWLERVMLPGVAFVLNDDHQVRPGLPSVRRVGAITTTPHTRRRMRSVGDNGKRTLMRSFRGNCAKFCRRTFVSIRDGDGDAAARVEKAFSSW